MFCGYVRRAIVLRLRINLCAVIYIEDEWDNELEMLSEEVVTGGHRSAVFCLIQLRLSLSLLMMSNITISF